MTHTTVTAAEMKALEKAANDNGLLYIQMMENAGRAAFAQLRRRLPGPARLLVAGGQGQQWRGRLRHSPGGRQTRLAGAGAAG